MKNKSDKIYQMKQRDVDMSPLANIIAFRLNLTHTTFALGPGDL